MIEAAQRTVGERIAALIDDLFAREPADLPAGLDLFDDLGLDSLDLVQLEIAIEQEFSIEIRDDENKSRTFGDLVAFVEHKVG